MTKYQATEKVKRAINEHNLTKEEVAKQIGISRPTLDARLSWHTWKVSEITHIKNWNI